MAGAQETPARARRGLSLQQQPATFGPYRVLRPLGRGAVGTVHLAVHGATGVAVALKVVQLGASGFDDALNEARGRFLVEAYAARRLSHPGIVAVLAAGEERGRGWIAMELVPGSDLGRYTHAARLLPEPVVLRIGERIARALAYAHGAGIVHRDVKPSNVMVHWPNDTLKLTDFGLARTVDAQATRTGLVLGSPAYMAPEQLAGAAPDARSDLYALGVTLFQLLAGRLPHDAPSMGELLRQVAHQAAPDIRSVNASASAALAALLQGLLAKEPTQRIPQAGEAADALAQLAACAPAITDGPMSRT